MISPHSARCWLYRGLFVALALVTILWLLLPHGGGRDVFPGPDLLLCLIFAWTYRRPDFVPLWLMALVLVLADFLLMRPPGLWAGLVVIAVLFLQGRNDPHNDLPFAAEWAMVTVMILALTLLYTALLSLLMVPDIGPGARLIRAVMSALAYPFVVALSRYGLRVERLSLTDTEARRAGR